MAPNAPPPNQTHVNGNGETYSTQRPIYLEATLEQSAPEVKPGYRSTEFYLTIANAIVQMLIAVGVVTQTEADALVALFLPLLLATVPVVSYIYGRSYVKAQAFKAGEQGK